MALALGTICPYRGAAMETDALIDSLAKDLGVTAGTRKKWRQRGVPHRWRLPIIELAANRGVELSSADFDRSAREAA
jgi:hypothetical protein